MLALAVMVGCSREQRDLRNIPATRAFASQSIPASHIQPGGSKPMPQGGTSMAKMKNPFEGNAYALSEGKNLYLTYNCFGCHYNGGGDMGAPLINDKFRYGDSPADIYESISGGRPHGMPAWGRRVPEYQIWELVVYVRSLRGSESQVATPARTDDLEKTREETQ